MVWIFGRKDIHPKALLAGMIGNVLEWYDFALYGFLAVILADLFFPSGEGEVLALLATYGVFAAGFLMRPIGAVLFGYIGDRVSKRRALTLSIVLMGASTLLLGFLPTYQAIGIWAAVLLTLLRLLQGLSVGGEFSTSVTYVVERAPKGMRGVMGSTANVGSIIGMLLGSGAAALVTGLLPYEALISWGWRVPFIFGGVLGMLALFMQRWLPATELHEEEGRHISESPLHAAFTKNRAEVILAFLMSVGYAVFFYMPMVYLPTYAVEFAGLSLENALLINTAATAFLILLIPLFGVISDRYLRRRTLLIIGFLLAGVFAYPLFYAVLAFGIAGLVVAQFALAILVAIPLGAAPAMYVELFPKEDRLTAYSLTYNFSLGIFGGTAPIIATWLVYETGIEMMPAIYLVGTIILSLVGLSLMRDRSREPLRDHFWQGNRLNIEGNIHVDLGTDDHSEEQNEADEVEKKEQEGRGQHEISE